MNPIQSPKLNPGVEVGTDTIDPKCATNDQLWRENIERLRDTTQSINLALLPKIIQTDFVVNKLQEYGSDVDLEFCGEVRHLDDGSMAAGFRRTVHDDMEFVVVLIVPANYTHVDTQVALVNGDNVLAESGTLSRKSVLGALDAAVASFDSLVNEWTEHPRPPAERARGCTH